MAQNPRKAFLFTFSHFLRQIEVHDHHFSSFIFVNFSFRAHSRARAGARNSLKLNYKRTNCTDGNARANDSTLYPRLQQPLPTSGENKTLLLFGLVGRLG